MALERKDGIGNLVESHETHAVFGNASFQGRRNESSIADILRDVPLQKQLPVSEEEFQIILASYREEATTHRPVDLIPGVPTTPIQQEQNTPDIAA